MKLGSTKYKELGVEEKSKYDDMAVEDKKRYANEMKNYSPPSDNEVDSKKKKPKKDPNAPKKPLNSYNYFCQANRPKILKDHPNASFSEMSKMNSEAYRKLTSEQKKEFEAKVRVDKERYAKEMKVYEAKSKPIQKKTPAKKVEQDSDESEDSSSGSSESGSDSD